MNDHPILTDAHQTLRAAVTDLQEAADWLAGSMATGQRNDLETERWARVLDRLAEEVSEAAQMVRATR